MKELTREEFSERLLNIRWSGKAIDGIKPGEEICLAHDAALRNRAEQAEKFAKFGKSLYEHYKDGGSCFFYSEESEAICDLAVKAGLMHRAKYSPEGVHKDFEVEDAEPGDECWFWTPLQEECERGNNDTD